MKRVFLSVVVLCSISLTGMAQAQATYSNYHSGNRFDFEINGERLSKSPVWSEDQECPPLPARAAVKIANAQLHKLFDDADKWTNPGLHLARLGDHWVYLVEFDEPPPAGALEHLSSPFRIPVLMNGDTVEPKVSQWNH
jgi:hypothetical protein